MQEYNINDPRKLNITPLVSNNRIAGSFVVDALGDTLGGNFNVYFYEEWEPEGD